MDIDGAWKSCCRVMLGAEVGPLEGYKGYLFSGIEPIGTAKSAISGGEVAVSRPERFGRGAKFIAEGEWQAYDAALQKKAQLCMDDIKDLDSAVQALSEHLCYSGNIVLGNSGDVAGSDMCSNAFCVQDSHEIYDSRYVAYSHGVRFCEFMFGCSTPAESKFGIRKFIGRRSTRCLETVLTNFSSDCYYTANCEGCTDCMFCFNQRSKSHAIGNLQLSREKYAELKAKLLGEMRQALLAKKRLPTIFEIISSPSAPTKPAGAARRAPDALPFPDRSGLPEYAEIEQAFQEVSGVVLGKRLSGMGDYAAWLQKRLPPMFLAKSAKSGKPVCIAGWPYFQPIAGVSVTFEESLELGGKGITPAQAEALSLQNAPGALLEVKCTTPELKSGRNIGVIDCGVHYTSSYCYRNSSSVDSKYCAFSLWPRQSEHCFGCYFLFSSSFCLKCHNSALLTRCFEVNHSKSCSDCYFCHNCENVHDSMFCFNAKNLKYAIGNVQVGREKYMKVKAAMLSQAASRLEKDKKLGISVFGLNRSAK